MHTYKMLGKESLCFLSCTRVSKYNSRVTCEGIAVLRRRWEKSHYYFAKSCTRMNWHIFILFSTQNELTTFMSRRKVNDANVGRRWRGCSIWMGKAVRRTEQKNPPQWSPCEYSDIRFFGYLTHTLLLLGYLWLSPSLCGRRMDTAWRKSGGSYIQASRSRVGSRATSYWLTHPCDREGTPRSYRPQTVSTAITSSPRSFSFFLFLYLVSSLAREEEKVVLSEKGDYRYDKSVRLLSLMSCNLANVKWKNIRHYRIITRKTSLYLFIYLYIKSCHIISTVTLAYILCFCIPWEEDRKT